MFSCMLVESHVSEQKSMSFRLEHITCLSLENAEKVEIVSLVTLEVQKGMFIRCLKMIG